MNSKKNNYIYSIISIIVVSIINFVILPICLHNKSPFPSIIDICNVYSTHEGANITRDFLVTFIRSLISITLGILVGVIMGIIMIFSKKIYYIILPWHTILKITPAIIWIPALIFMLGYSSVPTALGVLYSSLFVSTAFYERFCELSVEEVTFHDAEKTKRWKKIRYCYLPTSIAGIAVGTKIGGSIALIIVVVGEAIVMDGGLGHAIVSYLASYSHVNLWATILALSLLSIIYYFAFYICEKVAGVK